MEKHYAFIKNGVLENTLVFADKDDELANRICIEQGYDEAIWLDDSATPIRYSSWDGKTFTPPTEDYLISIGIITLPEPTE